MDGQPQRLWGVREVAEYLGVPITTLYQWRYHGYGPRHGASHLGRPLLIIHSG